MDIDWKALAEQARKSGIAQAPGAMSEAIALLCEAMAKREEERKQASR